MWVNPHDRSDNEADDEMRSGGSSSLKGASKPSDRMFFVKKNKNISGGTRSAQELPYHWIKKDTCGESRGTGVGTCHRVWQV